MTFLKLYGTQKRSTILVIIESRYEFPYEKEGIATNYSYKELTQKGQGTKNWSTNWLNREGPTSTKIKFPNVQGTYRALNNCCSRWWFWPNILWTPYVVYSSISYWNTLITCHRLAILQTKLKWWGWEYCNAECLFG